MKKRRQLGAIALLAQADIKGGKRFTWRRWASMVAEVTGLPRKQVELVLRASNEFQSATHDFDCELANEISNLDPDWRRWAPGT